MYPFFQRLSIVPVASDSLSNDEIGRAEEMTGTPSLKYVSVGDLGLWFPQPSRTGKYIILDTLVRHQIILGVNSFLLSLISIYFRSVCTRCLRGRPVWGLHPRDCFFLKASLIFISRSYSAPVADWQRFTGSPTLVVVSSGSIHFVRISNPT